MNIVYSSSDMYAECTGISIWSLFENNKDINELNVYILSSDISNSNENKLRAVAEKFNRKLNIIDAKQDFIDEAEKFDLPLMRGAYNTYSRICLNKWFSNLEKVLVIDSDTLICGSVKEFWDTDLEGKLIGAVPEVAMYGKFNKIEDPSILENVDTYYNMGICLVNLKEWRDKDIDLYMLKKIKEETSQFRVADQSIINKYLNPYIKRVALKYNYYSVVHDVKYSTIQRIFYKKEVFQEQEFDDAKNDARIIHYFGHQFERPWFRKNAAYRKKDYLKVRNRTPWSNEKMREWKKSGNFVIDIYDNISYFLLYCGARDICLKFRYIYGQKIKGILKMGR